MTAILIVDSDIKFVALCKEHLRREQFKVTATRSGETGVTLALSKRFAIVTIDSMTPDLGGLDALQRIRRHTAVPIVMMADTDDGHDRALCLELGADDYVSKSCGLRELTARLRAILRRTHSAELDRTQALTVGPLTLWPERRRAEWRTSAVHLTSTEYSLLEVLALHAGRTVSKEQLSTQVLGRPLAKYDRSIDVHLSSIRHKLGALDDGRSCIQTVFRKGYQLLKE